MTTLKQYREQMRQQAAEEKKLIQRTPGGFFTTISGVNANNPLIFEEEGELKMLTAASLQRLDRRKAQSLVEQFFSTISNSMSVLFSDRSAARSFMSLAGSYKLSPDNEEDANNYRAALRTLEVLLTLNFASGMKIMTELLNHRWWLPAGMVASSIDSWLGDPSLPGANTAAKLLALERMTRWNEEYSANFTPKESESISKSEASIASSSIYYGVQSSISRMRDVEAHGSKVARVLVSSPGLQHELSLNGLITQGLVESVGREGFEVSVYGSTKLAADKKVDILCDGGVRSGSSRTVLDLSVDQKTGATLLTVGGSLSRTRIGVGDRIFLSNSPFVGRPAVLENKRWVSKEAYEGPIPSYIPVDVLAAAQ